MLGFVLAIAGLGAVGATVLSLASATAAAAATTGTTVAVSSSANPSVGGQTTTLRATVAPVAPATGSPTGTVTFRAGARVLGTAAWWFGAYNLPVSDLDAGSHLITATYNGNTTYAASSTTLTQVVAAASTVTTLTSSVNPSTAGDGVTLTAAITPVAPGAGTPTGTVTFSEGATVLGTAAPWHGAATYALPKLPAGAHTITASYAGDTRNRPSAATLTQTIKKMPTTLAVTTSLDPIVTGQRATVTAKVTPAASTAGSPSTSVVFKEGSTTLGTAVWWFGSYSLLLPPLPAGDHVVTASFAGDGVFAPSSASLVQRVRTSTSVVASAAPAPAVTGQTVTLSATVVPATNGGPTPTGTVVITEGSTTLATPALSAGRVTAPLTGLAAGDHTLGLRYVGDGAHAGSTTSTVIVVRVASTLTVTTAANPSTPGAPVSFRAQITPAPAGGPLATGTVTLYAGVTSYGTAPLVDGGATVTLTGLQAGDHTVTATYSGDAKFRAADVSLAHVVGAPTAPTTESAPLTVTKMPTSYRPIAAHPTSVGAHNGGDGGNQIRLPSDGNILWGSSDYAGTDANGAEFMVNNVVMISSPADPLVLRQPRNAAGAAYQLVNPSSPGPCTAPGSKRVFWNAGMVALPQAGWDRVLIWFQSYCLSSDLVLTAQSIGVAQLDYHPAMANDMVTPWSTRVTILDEDLYGKPSGVQMPELGPDGLIYLYQCYTNGGAPTGGADMLGCKVARVAPLDAADAAKYRYWDGAGWSATSEATAAFMSTPDTTSPSRNPAGMFKVTYIPQMGVWVLGSQAWPGHDGTPLFRIARSPQGPWSTPITLPYIGCDPTTGHSCYGSMVSAALSDATHLSVVYFDKLGQEAPGYTGKHTGRLHMVTAEVAVPAPGVGPSNDPKPSTTTLTSSANPATAGQAVVLTATVAAPPPVADEAGVVDTATPATGTVTFTEGATTLGTATWFFGTYAMNLPALAPGSHTITATYSGDEAFAESSATIVVTVLKAQTTISATSSVNPVAFGRSATLRATLRVTAPGAGTPSGSVTFREGATVLGTSPLFFGAYSLALPALPVGAHTITVTYPGDLRYGPSTTTITQTVQRAVPTIAFTSSSSTARQGTDVTFKAVLSSGMATAPTGSVTFTEGPVVLGTATFWFGSYSLTLRSLPVGTHAITAHYSGDANFLPGSVTLTQTITP